MSIVRQFNKDMHPDSTPMISRVLNVHKWPIRLKEDNEVVSEDELSLSKYNRRIIVLSIIYSTKCYILSELVS